MPYNDDDLRRFATSRQVEYLDALEKYGEQKKAAESLGVTPQTISAGLMKLKNKVGMQDKNLRYMKVGTGKDKRLTILVLPDAQVKPDDDLAFLRCQGEYIVDKKPDIIVCIGDFSDMESLSSYDKNKRSYEGRRYKNDVESAITGMKVLLAPLRAYNQEQLKKRKEEYKPRMILTLGNHEHRINRATELDAMLYGTLSVDDLKYKEFGWEVIPFLEVIVIGGIAFSHYFTTGTMGKPCTTAQTMLNKKHMSCIAGHQQGLQIATAVRADGVMLTCIIAGSSYEHKEDYLGPQGNNHWRGVIMLHNVHEGQYDHVLVPNSYLLERYNPDGKKIFTAPEEQN